MIPGMYAPLEYWELLSSSDRILGPRGGRRYTEESLERYFNNTLFVDLLQFGWIGSQGIQTERISCIIGTILQEGRSVMLAAKQPV